MTNWHARLLEIAKAQIGVLEFKGAGSNPNIVEMWRVGRVAGPPVNDDDVAWCSAFLCACVETAGIKSTRSGLAKSWIKWGQPLNRPRVGGICVLNRANDPAGRDWRGHVGIIAAVAETTIRLLSGNANNSVCVAEFARERIAAGGLRWALDVPFTDEIAPLGVTVGGDTGDR